MKADDKSGITWSQLLELGKSPADIEQAIREGVDEGEFSAEEAEARVKQLHKQASKETEKSNARLSG